MMRTASGMKVPGIILAPETSRPGLIPRRTAPGSPVLRKDSLGPGNSNLVATDSPTTEGSGTESQADVKAKKNPLSRGTSVRATTPGGRSGFAGAFKKGLSMTTVPALSRPNGDASSRPGTGQSQALDGVGDNPGANASTDTFATSSRQGSSAGLAGAAAGVPVTQNTLSQSTHMPDAQSRPTTSLSLNLATKPAVDQTLFTTLHDLFSVITHQPKQSGVVAPQLFIQQLKHDNELFRSTMHQDAHEFFNYLINEISEDAAKREAEKRKASGIKEVNKSRGNQYSIPGANAPSWVQDLFMGVLTNETRCLTCETVTSRDEAFLDLSIDIEQNTSVTACLRQFSKSEMLQQRDKYSCERCCSLQEAEKRMKIKKLPNVLALHLKRFKYQEDVQRFMKLAYRVVFPFELRLFNTIDDAPDADRMYRLWAIVVHIGAGLHHGHYVAIVRSGDKWLLFDDDTVSTVEESDIQKYYGDTPGYGSGYVLFYQAVDLDTESLLPHSIKEGRRSEREAAEAAIAAAAQSQNSRINGHYGQQPLLHTQLPPPASPAHTPQPAQSYSPITTVGFNPFSSPTDPLITPMNENRNPFDQPSRTYIAETRSPPPVPPVRQRTNSHHDTAGKPPDLAPRPPVTGNGLPNAPLKSGNNRPTPPAQIQFQDIPSTNGSQRSISRPPSRQHSMSVSNYPSGAPSPAMVTEAPRGTSPVRSKTEVPGGNPIFARSQLSNSPGAPPQADVKEKEKEKSKWWKLGKGK